MVNLREGADTAVLKTSACRCAAQFAGFCQVSTKNLQDVEGAYLPTVLRHITAEILAALIRGWLVYIHCNSGIHRAPSAAVALLLIHNSAEALSFDQAKAFVKASRPAAFKGENQKRDAACCYFSDQLLADFRMPPAGVVRRPRPGGGFRDVALIPPLAEKLQTWIPFVPHSGASRVPQRSGASAAAAAAAAAATTAATTAACVRADAGAGAVAGASAGASAGVVVGAGGCAAVGVTAGGKRLRDTNTSALGAAKRMRPEVAGPPIDALYLLLS